MECANLDGFLEAFLEGKLRRSQFAMLRRHLSACPACRARVEQLRSFERELHSRLQPMAENQPLWSGLEMDLVGQTHGPAPRAQFPRELPPAPTGPRPRAGRPARPVSPRPAAVRPTASPGWAGLTAGIVITLAAAGAVWQLVATWSGFGRIDIAALAVPHVMPAAGEAVPAAPVEIGGDDPERLRDWLESTFGLVGSVPLPGPPVRLLGARRVGPADPLAAVVVYTQGDDVIWLVMAPRGDAAAVQAAQALGGTGQPVSWSSGSIDYVLVGEQPTTPLDPFRPWIPSAGTLIAS
jgi:anti-sigma factor RsiW